MPALAKLTISTPDSFPSLRVIAIEGQVDQSNLDTVSTELEALVQTESITSLILDFSKLEFLNSKVIGYLADLHTRLNEKNRGVYIVNPTPAVNDILDLVGLNSLITCYPTLEEAIRNAK